VDGAVTSDMAVPGDDSTQVVATMTRIDERTQRLLDGLERVQDAVDRMTGQIGALSQDQALIKRDLASLDGRVSTLEAGQRAAVDGRSWRSWAPPAAAAVGAVLAVQQLADHFTH